MIAVNVDFVLRKMFGENVRKPSISDAVIQKLPPKEELHSVSVCTAIRFFVSWLDNANVQMYLL